MKYRRFFARLAAGLLALGLAVMPVMAESGRNAEIPGPGSSQSRYRYIWRVEDENGIGWADVYIEASVTTDLGSGEIVAVTPGECGIYRSFLADEELVSPEILEAVADPEAGTLRVKGEGMVQFQYLGGLYTSGIGFRQEYTFRLDDPPYVFQEGIAGINGWDMAIFLSVASGVLRWVLRIAVILWVWSFMFGGGKKAKQDGIPPLEPPAGQL